jgi:hypothetical protein
LQRISKRIVPYDTSECQRCANSSSHSNLDVWLSRVSHFSQFGLFALTIGAFYFTVIPLYKTAALEESIARREAELSAMNSKLVEATAALETVRFEIYERNRGDLIQGIVTAAPYCSGLLMHTTKSETSKNRELGSNLLKIDAAQCIQDEFNERKSEAILTSEDYKKLNETVRQVAANLSQIQQKTILDIENVPRLAEKNPSTLSPPGPYASEVEQLDRLVEEVAPGLLDKKAKFKAAVERTRSNMTIAYHNLVLKEFLNLRGIEWPTGKKK